MTDKIVYRMVDRYFTAEENARINEYKKAGDKEGAMAYMHEIGDRWDKESGLATGKEVESNRSIPVTRANETD